MGEPEKFSFADETFLEERGAPDSEKGRDILLPVLDDSPEISGGQNEDDFNLPMPFRMEESERIIQDDQNMDMELENTTGKNAGDEFELSGSMMNSGNESDDSMEIDLSDDELDAILDSSDSSFFQDLEEEGNIGDRIELPEAGDPFAGAADPAGLPPLDESHASESSEDLHDITHSGSSADESADDDVALSEDELGSILDDVDESRAQDAESLGADFDFDADLSGLDSMDNEMPDSVADSFYSSGLESEDEEEVALSEDELGNILNDVDESSSLDVSGFADQGDEEEVALSEDELGNILNDVDESSSMEAEGLTSDEELESLFGESASVPGEMEEEPEFVTAGSGDVSEDEFSMDTDFELPDLEQGLEDAGEEAVAGLSDALAAGAKKSEHMENYADAASMVDDFVDLDSTANAETFPDVTDFDEINTEPTILEEEPMGEELEPAMAAGFMDMDEDEDEDITLTSEELGNIVSDVDEIEEIAEGISAEESAEFGPTEEIKEEVPGSFFEDFDEEEEPIALSDEELENILEDVEPGELPEVSGIDDFIGGEVETEGTAGEYEHDFEEAAAVAMEEHPREGLVESTAASQNLDKEELRKMISYLDGLFDELPDNTIREFSKSEYFDLYKKIMTDLGI